MLNMSIVLWVRNHRRNIYIADSLPKGHLLTFLGVCILNNDIKYALQYMS